MSCPAKMSKNPNVGMFTLAAPLALFLALSLVAALELAYVGPSPSDGGAVSDTSPSLNVSTTDANDTYSFFNDSLVFWMPLDDVNASGDPTDISLQGNNGTVIQNATQADSGRFGKGFIFDGNGDYVDCGNDTSLDIDTNLTISLWFKLNESWNGTSSGRNGLIARSDATQAEGDATKNDWGIILVDNDNGKMRFMTFGGNTQTARDNWTSGVWYHIVVVHVSSSNNTIYVQGVEDNDGGDYSAGAIDGTINNNLTVGRAEFVEHIYLNGTIDDVMIFNRSLSANEVRALYNSSEYSLERNLSDLSEETYSYTAYAVDADGNRKNSNLTFDVDTTAPSVDWSWSTDRKSGEGSINVTVNASEALLACNVNISGTNHSMTMNSSTTFYYEWTVPSRGVRYILRAYCNDTANNTGNTSQAWYKRRTVTVEEDDDDDDGGGAVSGTYWGSWTPPEETPSEEPPEEEGEEPPEGDETAEGEGSPEDGQEPAGEPPSGPEEAPPAEPGNASEEGSVEEGSGAGSPETAGEAGEATPDPGTDEQPADLTWLWALAIIIVIAATIILLARRRSGGL